MATASASSPRSELRMVAACFLMPFVAGALAFLAEMTLWSHAQIVVQGTTAYAGGSSNLHIARSLALAAGFMAIFVTVLGAIPLAVWRMRRGTVPFGHALIAGAALGNTPVAVLLVLIVIHNIGRGAMPDNPGDLWYGAGGAFRTITEGLFVGMGCAAVFWAVALRGSEVDREP